MRRATRAGESAIWANCSDRILHAKNLLSIDFRLVLKLLQVLLTGRNLAKGVPPPRPQRLNLAISRILRDCEFRQKTDQGEQTCTRLINSP